MPANEKMPADVRAFFVAIDFEQSAISAEETFVGVIS
jgi:hypothetical protein